MWPTIEDMIQMIASPNREAIIALYESNAERFGKAWGSSHNHQAWEGGYLMHIRDTMAIAIQLFDALARMHPLPFELSDALVVLAVHDLEKPWKSDFRFADKAQRLIFRNGKIASWGIHLTPEQQNAVAYVEGEGEFYRSDSRVMGELAAFCHMCDVASARIWHSLGNERIGIGVFNPRGIEGT